MMVQNSICLYVEKQVLATEADKAEISRIAAAYPNLISVGGCGTERADLLRCGVFKKFSKARVLVLQFTQDHDANTNPVMRRRTKSLIC